MRVNRRPRRVAYVLLACVVSVTCARAAPTAPTTPRGIAQAWSDAARRDDAHAAYRLLSAETRRTLPFAEFQVRWQDSRVERQRQANALAEKLAEPGSLLQHATVILPDGKTAQLVGDGNLWSLEAPLLSSARASTPADALRLFAAAIESRNVEALLRVLTSARRAGLRDALLAFVGGLQSHASTDIEVVGDRATLRWSDGKRRWKINLRKEGDEWRVDDIDPL
jgi:hypothetical protein